jgi:hypothetical protein
MTMLKLCKYAASEQLKSCNVTRQKILWRAAAGATESPLQIVPLPLNGEAIFVATVGYSENKPTAMHREWTTDVSSVTNPRQWISERLG